MKKNYKRRKQFNNAVKEDDYDVEEDDGSNVPILHDQDSEFGRPIRNDNNFFRPTVIEEDNTDVRPMEFNSTPLCQSESVSDPDIDYDYDSLDYLFDSDFDESDNEFDQDCIGDNICNWYYRNPSIPKSAVNDLLKVLQPHLPVLPLTFDTLLRNQNHNMYNANPHTVLSNTGEYVYFGISTTILQCFSNSNVIFKDDHMLNCNGLLLKFNLDGINMFKSSNTTVWTTVLQIPCFTDHPMLVGIYVGSEKPSHQLLLEPIVNELNSIIRDNKLKIGNIDYTVDKVLFVCDAPARAMLKLIKGHTGYFACERCEVEGTLQPNGTVVFDEFDAALRTDQSFRQKTNEEHHHGSSLIETLPVNMISCFVLDCMHLVYLGVMRRLLYYWLQNGPLSCRISGNSQKYIDANFLILSRWLPCEFSRRPRPLSEIKKFKATEFSTILKYTGIVAFMNVIDQNIFKNFLLFHVGITILTSKQFCLKHNDFAQACIVEFLNNSKLQYGSKFFSYNVHSLFHLVDDVKTNLVSLNSMSAYPFENFFIKLKKCIKSPYLPVKQVIKRVEEGFFSKTLLFTHKNDTPFVLSVKTFIYPKYLPLILSCHELYKSISFSNFKLHSKLSDAFFSDTNNNICQFLYVSSTPSEPTIVAYILPKIGFQDLYTYPCRSSLFNIFQFTGDFFNELHNKSDVKLIPCKLISTKFVCIPLPEVDNAYCFVPMNNDSICEHC